MSAIKTKFLLLFSISLLLFSCKDKNITIGTNFDDLEVQKFHFGEKLPVNFDTGKSTADSYVIKINNTIFNQKENIVLNNKNTKFGANKISLELKFGDQIKTVDGQFFVYPTSPAKELTYSVLQEYPHNPELFTEGFIYQNGIIYESAGQYGKSKIVKYTLGSTNYLSATNNTPDIFGEGIAIVGNQIFQMSYKERKGFVYNLSDLTPVRDFVLPQNIIEGWGATTVGKNIVVSDSSSELKFFDFNWNPIKSLTVLDSEKIYTYVNELEYAQPYIYANVFGENIILVIDPNTGEVVAKGDFSKIVEPNKTNEEAVLNGIAYMGGNTFLLTGKNWSKIYKVELKF